MVKKILSFLLIYTFVLSGCSRVESQPPQLDLRDQALNIQLGGEPLTLDPTFCTDTVTTTYLMHLFEGLTILDSNGEVAPGIAEKWEVKNNNLGLPVYTFYLNPEARWSDGSMVEAADFIYAWKRALTPDIQAPKAYQLYPIKGARAMKEDVAQGREGEMSSLLGVVEIDKSTLEVTLEGPCPYFLELCASAPIYLPLKDKTVDQYPESWTNSPESLVSNGAYLLESWVHDGSIRMSKNPSYHQSHRVKQEKLNFILTGEDTAIWEAFQQGQIQFASTFPIHYMEEAKKMGVLQIAPKMATYALIFHIENIEDARVRQALSLAINRVMLTNDILADGSIPAGAIIPQGRPGAVLGQDFRNEAGEYLSTVASHYGTNLERARSLLKEAGYENGNGLPEIVYLTNDTTGNLKIAQAIAQNWGALGVKVKIQALGWNDYVEVRETGDFDVVRYTFLADGHTDPVVFLDLWTSENFLNLAGYKNQRFDDLIAATYTGEVLSSETDKKRDVLEDKKDISVIRKRRIEYLHEAEGLLVSQDAIVVPLYYYSDAMLVSSQLSGISVSPLGTRWFGEANYILKNE